MLEAQDALGRISTRTLPLGQSESYTHDLRDRLKIHTQPNGAVLTYGYDLAGNRTSVTVDSPTGDSRTTTYTYDSLIRLESVTDIQGVASYGYDAVGSLASVSLANGTSRRDSCP